MLVHSSGGHSLQDWQVKPGSSRTPGGRQVAQGLGPSSAVSHLGDPHGAPGSWNLGLAWPNPSCCVHWVSEPAEGRSFSASFSVTLPFKLSKYVYFW